MKNVVIISSLVALCMLSLVQPGRSDDPNEETKGVLGGSPPIYAGPPTSPAIDQTYRAHRNVPKAAPHGTAPKALGSRCATRLGLFGPGPIQSVGSPCAVLDANSRKVAGVVVSDRSGSFCATPAGAFGPGPLQPLGSPCRAESNAGISAGKVVE